MIKALLLAFFLPVTMTPETKVEPQADRVLVEKARRTLTLFHAGNVLKTYSVCLGFEPEGHKREEGDGKTPEGIYEIDWRNPQSKFHLSLHINYPSAGDQRFAEARQTKPGGEIMIHGLPNGCGVKTEQYRGIDWTAGCIAVTNAEIEEIWRLVPDHTPIEILP